MFKLLIILLLSSPCQAVTKATVVMAITSKFRCCFHHIHTIFAHSHTDQQCCTRFQPSCPEQYPISFQMISLPCQSLIESCTDWGLRAIWGSCILHKDTSRLGLNLRHSDEQQRKGTIPGQRTTLTPEIDLHVSHITPWSINHEECMALFQLIILNCCQGQTLLKKKFYFNTVQV